MTRKVCRRREKRRGGKRAEFLCCYLFRLSFEEPDVRISLINDPRSTSNKGTSVLTALLLRL